MSNNNNIYEKPIIPAGTKIPVKQLQQQPLLEVSSSAFAFLFSELVQYSQKRVTGIPQLEHKLGQLGHHVGLRHLELSGYKDLLTQLNCNTSISALLQPSSSQSQSAILSLLGKTVGPMFAKQPQLQQSQHQQHQQGPGPKQLVQILMYITQTLWTRLFYKPADSLEKSSTADDEYMIIDNEPVINKFISVPRDLQQLNCGAFVAGIVEAYLTSMVRTGCRCTAHSTPTQYHPLKTTYLIRFDSILNNQNNSSVAE